MHTNKSFNLITNTILNLFLFILKHFIIFKTKSEIFFHFTHFLITFKSPHMLP